MFKILIIYPNAVMQNPPPVSIALFYALLKDFSGVEVKLFDTTLYDVEEKTSDKTKEKNLQVRPFDFKERGVELKRGNIYEDLHKMARSFEPDLIMLSCNEITYPLGISLLEKIRDRKAIKVAGGVFPTFAPELVLKNEDIDMVCIGEGEDALVELVNKLMKKESILNIKNLWIKQDGKILKNPLRPLIKLDELPIPDYDIFEEARFYRPMAGKVWRLFPIETNRGCPYQCSYCNSPSQKGIYANFNIKNFFRKKSIDRIGQEIQDVVDRYQAEYIYFLSDTLLCMNDHEFDRFCRMYSKFKLPFWCQNRPEMVTYPRMQRLKEIGCHRMSIGVEHGNEIFRRDVLKKPVKNETIINAFDILAKVGIPVSVNNMIGFPMETRELAFDTIMLNRKLKFDTSNAYAFTPFHGTELYDICVQKGYFKAGSALKVVTKGTVLEMPQFPKEEIDGLVKTFSLYARMPEKYFAKIRIAEKNDAEGNKTFDELRDIYQKIFFN